MKFYQIPQSIGEEIDYLERSILDFRRGNMHATQFKGIRVPFGVYEQRKDNSFMMRIRCTGGGATPAQLTKTAELARQYGSDLIHLTTRQEMQLHDVRLEDVPAVMRELLKLGLSTRGGGGNTIRNIMASYDSGVNPSEAFDVGPYAVALSSRLIAEPDSWALPRKMKISFSSLTSDNANASVQDVGFIAQIRDGQKGFKVYVAGGMGAKSNPGHILYEFVPADRFAAIAEAVKSMFYKYGNRKNKHHNRLRFLWEELGEEKFLKLLQQEYRQREHDASLSLELPEIPNTSADPNIAPVQVDGAAYKLWRQRYVTSQQQAGLLSIKLPVFLGNIGTEDALKLARCLEPFGDNVLRFSMDQNIHLRNIPEQYLGNIFQTLSQLQTFSGQPALFSNMIACTGANTCRLGICLPRGVTPAIQKALSESGMDLDPFRDFKIHISGCPNSCGQHAIADLGFFGRVQRKEDRAFPTYNVVAGAVSEPGKNRLGIPVSWVPSYSVPKLVRDILARYAQQKDRHASFAAYIDSGGKEDIAALCRQYQDVPNFFDDKNYYFDWGAEEIFSTSGLGQGECSAGLFDMIEVDEKAIKTNRELAETSDDPNIVTNALYNLVFSASRMLLIARGIAVKSHDEVFDAFISSFIQPQLVAEKFREIVQKAKDSRYSELPAHKEEIFALGEALIALYQGMDNSLTFPAETENSPAENEAEESAPEHAEPEEHTASESRTPDRFKDYRGVACPMNFVKTKIDLATMESGHRLEIYLDDGAPIDNVPRSVEAEGHKILAQTRIGEYWSVLIEKV
ncbi:MAG: sulfite reductase subunit beta (hemoprotein) [bacterium]|nr:sulfite reductase subunit beta (hemoprotein) [bacterium]